MNSVWRGRGWWWRRYWRLWAPLAALTLLALCTRSTTVAVRSSALFARRSPATVAHLLADFNNQPHLHPHMGEWYVEEESSNHTSWSYSVRYSCGPRCSGLALVRAHEADEHRVHVARTECTHPSLAPFFRLCEESEVEAVVRSAEGSGAEGWGASYEEVAVVRCAALRVASGACAAEENERARRRLVRLRTLLQ